MKEDFLHYAWKYQKFDSSNLSTVSGEKINIKRIGDHNINRSGPDFFNVHLHIDEQLWVGNLEIHVNSSDWYAHRHEEDRAYDNVILHVVWNHDIEIYRKDQSMIPTLVLESLIQPKFLKSYLDLLHKKKNYWIPCQGQLQSIPLSIQTIWKEQLYVQRLIRKSAEFEEKIKQSNNNWEAVLYQQLFKNFGLNVNGASFESIAKVTDFSIVRKLSKNNQNLEALFFGQADLLKKNEVASGVLYHKELLEAYEFFQTKFKISKKGILPVEFFGLRPSNFPTVRIAQFSALYAKHTDLFSKLIEVNRIEEMYKLFELELHPFWDMHYTLSKESSKRKKKFSKSFIDLIVINTLIPVKFLYAKNRGDDNTDIVLKLIDQLPPEKNNIVDRFAQNGIKSASALESQALIQLKNEFCNKKKCLQCAFGNYLLNKKSNFS